MREASALDWRELVKAGRRDGDTGDYRALPIPREPRNIQISNDVVDGIRREAEGGPRCEVSEDENPCRDECGLPLLIAFTGDTRERQCHRCHRGQHHRRHHEDPCADKPANLTELGTRSGDHAIH